MNESGSELGPGSIRGSGGAASRQGRWLGQNCSDWRRSYQANPQPTARSEMQRHCQIYEHFLATGITPGRTD